MIKDDFYALFSNTDDYLFDFELKSFSDDLLKKKAEIPALYRYSSVDYYNIRGLETQSLFLSSIENLNDVFEGLSCEIDDEVLQKIDDFSECAYMKSFSEDKSNLLMWAHYADNYKGMCVEYDFQKLNDDVLWHLFPVFYSNSRRINRGLEHTISELCDLKRENGGGFSPNDIDFLKDIMFLFLSKAEAWDYEKEWRIVATYPQINNSSEEMNDDDISEFYRLQSRIIPVKGCVKAVYLGPRIGKTQREHIMEICSEKLGNIPVYSSKLSKNKYELDFIRCFME